jgi:ABC-type cobalamin/Fe3+-siderophores transport system ATPase subunit
LKSENSENKSDKEIKDNSERFKINCVLGNNGGGKSRLFEGILRNKEENICIDNIE